MHPGASDGHDRTAGNPTLVAWLEDLIAIPSPSGREEEVAAYLASWAAGQGLELHRDAGNVMIRLPGRDPERALVLHAHMDVVPPGDPSRWSTHPYRASRRDGRIYGAGASDDKAGIAVAMAVAASYRSAPPVDLWLVFVVREETDGAGSAAFARWFADRGAAYRQKGALLFESTEASWLEFSARGSLFLRVSIEGAAGHGAMKSALGPSAITRLAEAVRRLEALETAWRGRGHLEPTVLVTAVRAGDLGAPNRLDPLCEMAVDVRTDAALHDHALREVARALAGIPHRLEVLGACPPGYTDPESPFVRAFETVLPGVPKRPSTASNDLFAFTGSSIPAFVFGPGTKAAIHRPDEYVAVVNLDRALRAVQGFVRVLGSRADW